MIPIYLNKFSKIFPKFPDGRINYNGKEVLSVMLFLKYKDTYLLLKRSDKVKTAKNQWAVICGYYDRIVNIDEMMSIEAYEEIGINNLKSNKQTYYKEKIVKQNKTTFHVYSAVFTLETKPKIKLNKEHTEFAWVKKKNLNKYDLSKGTKTLFKEIFLNE